VPRKKNQQRRRPSGPPRQTILSNIIGEYLDPIDALFAVFFSILFALLFTLAYGILIYNGAIPSYFGRGYGPQLFIVILGAVTVWAVIDGVVYVLGEVLARTERYRLLQTVQASSSEEEAATAISYELDFILEPITSEEQRHALYRDMRAYLSQAEPQAVGVRREDVVGAVATVLVSVLAVLPSLLPLLLLPNDTAMAIRVSNVVSVLVIFAAGYSWGLHTNTNPWKIGLLLSSICLAAGLLATLLGGT